MTNKIIGIIVLVCVIVAAVLFMLTRLPHESASSLPTASSTSSTPESSSTPARNSDDSIEVTSPAPNALVEPPLHIAGSAKNSWYFEGQFRTELVDASGTVLMQTPAVASSDWTAPGFVPFSATLSFSAPTTTAGLLILKNANPSGDPSRDVIFAIPIRFK